MTQPLGDILVADFSRVLAGPLATATLADLGARVVKVERPVLGDDTRSWGPPFTSNSSSYFESANRNKESIVLDFNDPIDIGLARELARRADVLVENFRPGTLEKYGLGYDELHATNPRLIYCSITGFGSGGGAHLAGYDFLVQAVGGLMSITGEDDENGGSPTKVGVALVDILTAKDAVTGIMAALITRNASGEGQRIEVNLLSSLLAALTNQASSFLTTGISPQRLGNAHPSIAPYELLKCADGPLAVACGNDKQFRLLARVLGDDSLGTDIRFSTNSARVANRAELQTALTKLLASESTDVWVQRLTMVGVPAGSVGSVADGFALATKLGLDPLVEVANGHPPQVRHPVQYSKTPVTRYAAPPRLGEHSDDLRRWLKKEESL